MVSGINLVNATNLSRVTGNVKRPSGRHHGDLRRALEEAALELVVTKGVGGFTMAEASRRAGVSVAAPYKHYADRDALLSALVVRAYTGQREQYRAAMAGRTDPGEQLAAFAAAYVQFAADQPALFELTFAAGLDKARFPALAGAGQALFTELATPARALCSDDGQACRLILAIAASAHGHAVFFAEGVLDHLPDPLADAKREAATAAVALIAAYTGCLRDNR
jgi:AcrR family transcriptional regulator